MILWVRVTEVKVRHKVIKGVEGVVLGCFFSSFSEHIISGCISFSEFRCPDHVIEINGEVRGDLRADMLKAHAIIMREHDLGMFYIGSVRAYINKDF